MEIMQVWLLPVDKEWTLESGSEGWQAFLGSRVTTVSSVSIVHTESVLSLMDMQSMSVGSTGDELQFTLLSAWSIVEISILLGGYSFTLILTSVAT